MPFRSSPGKRSPAPWRQRVAGRKHRQNDAEVTGFFTVAAQRLQASANNGKINDRINTSKSDATDATDAGACPFAGQDHPGDRPLKMNGNCTRVRSVPTETPSSYRTVAQAF